MNCSEIESRLCAYRDELLPPEEKDRIEKHISTCVQCGKALADLKRTADLLRDLEAVEPPPFFAEKIMARVREEAGRKPGGSGASGDGSSTRCTSRRPFRPSP